MTVDLRLAREALILRLRVEFGLANLEEIEEWADAALLTSNSPQDELIDLAMARRAGAKDTVSILGRLAPKQTRSDDILLALAKAEPEKLSTEQLDGIFSHLERWAISCAGEQDGSAAAILFNAFDVRDALSLARTGQYGTIREARQQAYDFFDEARELSATSEKKSIQRGGA